MGKSKVYDRALDLMKGSSQFYSEVVQKTQSCDAKALGFDANSAKRLEVQPQIFIRVNQELNERYDGLCNAFQEIQSDTVEALELIMDSYQINPEDADSWLKIVQAYEAHKATLMARIPEGIYVNDREDNLVNRSVGRDYLVRDLTADRAGNSFVGNPLFALDQRLKAMIGAIRAIEVSEKMKGASVAAKMEKVLANNRKLGLFPRDYQRDVAPVLKKYVEDAVTESGLTLSDVQASPWVTDLVNALTEETTLPGDESADTAVDRDRFMGFLSYVEQMLLAAQKISNALLPSSKKAIQYDLEVKLEAVSMGSHAKASLTKAINKLTSGRSKKVDLKIKQAFEAFRAKAEEEGWFVRSYCDTWNMARQSYLELEQFIKKSIMKRVHASAELLREISKAHERVFEAHFTSLALKKEAADYVEQKRQQLTQILKSSLGSRHLDDSTVTFWESQYREFWETLAKDAEQRYVAATGSVMGSSASWQTVRRAASSAREALTRKGNMIFSFEALSRQAVLGTFDRVMAKTYAYTPGKKSEERKIQLSRLREGLAEAKSAADAAYLLTEGVIRIEAHHASSSLAYNISAVQKPSRAGIALRRIMIECESAKLIPSGYQLGLTPILEKAQHLISSYFSRFWVASFYERHCVGKLLDGVLRQQDMLRKASEANPYSIADACHGVSETVNTVYEEVRAYNDRLFSTKLIRFFGGDGESQFQVFLRSFCVGLNATQHQSSAGGDNGYYKFDFFSVLHRSKILERMRRVSRRIEQLEQGWISWFLQGKKPKSQALSHVQRGISLLERYRGDAKRISLTIHAMHDYLEGVDTAYAALLKEDLDWLIDHGHLESRAVLTGVTEAQADEDDYLSEFMKDLRTSQEAIKQAAADVKRKVGRLGR